MKTLLNAGLALVLTGFFAAAEAAPITGTGNILNDAALAGATVVDFNSAAASEVAILSQGDLTVTGLDGTFTVTSQFSGNFNMSGTHLQNGFDGVPSSWRFDFTSTVSAFAFNFGAADVVWTLRAFDANNIEIESYAIAPIHSSNNGEYYGIQAAGIEYATLTGATNTDWVMIDNFAFVSGGTTNAPNAVPAPAAVSLLLAGLGVMAARRQA